MDGKNLYISLQNPQVHDPHVTEPLIPYFPQQTEVQPQITPEGVNLDSINLPSSQNISPDNDSHRSKLFRPSSTCQLKYQTTIIPNSRNLSGIYPPSPQQSITEHEPQGTNPL